MVFFSKFAMLANLYVISDKDIGDDKPTVSLSIFISLIWFSEIALNYWIYACVDRYEFKDKGFFILFIVSELICIIILQLVYKEVDKKGMLTGSKMVYMLTAIFKILILLFVAIKVYLITKENI